MNKSFLFLFMVLFSTSTLYAQNKMKKELDSITSIDKAYEYIENKDNRDNKVITFNEEKHKTTLAKDLYGLSKGGVKTTRNDYDKIHYKVLEKNNVLHFRVSIIYFDGNKMSLSEINNLRDQIISKYKRGVSFQDLAKHYSMDSSSRRGGDLGWFTEGQMHPDFEEPIINEYYNLDDIYTINLEDKHWYYVVLQTHEPKRIKEVKVLKIVEPIR